MKWMSFKEMNKMKLDSARKIADFDRRLLNGSATQSVNRNAWYCLAGRAVNLLGLTECEWSPIF